MLKLLKYLTKKQVFALIYVVLLLFVQVVLDMKLPEYMSTLVNMITSETISSSEQILKVGLEMILVVLGVLITTLLVGYLITRVGAGFSSNLRKTMYKTVQNFSADEINKFSTASLITRTTNDISQVQRFLFNGLRLFIFTPMLATWAIVKIVQKSSRLSIATAVAVFLLVTFIVVIFLIVMPRFKKSQILMDKVNLNARESLTGIRVIRAYTREKYHEERFDKVNKELIGNYFFIGKVMSLFDPVNGLILSGLTLFIYWFGASLVSANVSNLGDILAFAQYSTTILFSFTMLTIILVNLPRVRVSANRINEVFKTKPSIKYVEKTIGEEVGEGVVEFKNVSFKYPNAKDYVLKNITFKANKGDTIAFIGSTGSGKSTLINLLARFYDPTEGEILLDGINIKDYSKEDLAKKLGYVPQQGILFKGTIEENLKLGKKEATEEEIKKACDIAQASSFISKFDEGYNRQIGQGGINVSGGQRQRLSIARALIKKPEVLIFDDSFSALDYKTDKKLRKAIKKEFANVTTLIVAQRVGTIMDADKIIVLDKGEMMGIGTHDELMQTCEIYKEIANSQISQKEVK